MSPDTQEGGMMSSATISPGEREQNRRIRENLADADVLNMQYEDWADLFEDRDPVEFL
jgi:hypothetical protein